MGTFSVTIEVAGPGSSEVERVEALVDTGARYTMLPGKILKRLGVQPHGSRPFILASGERITRDVGQARVRIDGRELITVVVFGEDTGPCLLGAVTLEEFGLAVDPLARKLIEVPGLLT